MGGTASTRGVSSKKAQEEPISSEELEKLVDLVLPPYAHSMDTITGEDIKLVRLSWKMIHDDKSRHFSKLRQEKEVNAKSCLEYFNCTFYRRLFGFYPNAAAFFTKSHHPSKKRFLSKALSLAFLHLNDKEEFDAMFTKLAHKHNEMGIRANEYVIFCNVLLWTVKECVGDEFYSGEVQTAWEHALTKILRVMSPLAVRYEIENGLEFMQKLQKQYTDTTLNIENSDEKSNSSKCESTDRLADLSTVEDSIDAREHSIHMREKDMEQSRDKIRNEKHQEMIKVEEVRREDLQNKLEEAENKFRRLQKMLEGKDQAVLDGGGNCNRSVEDVDAVPGDSAGPMDTTTAINSREKVVHEPILTVSRTIETIAHKNTVDEPISTAGEEVRGVEVVI